MNKKEVEIFEKQLIHLRSELVCALKGYNLGKVPRARPLNSAVALNSLYRILNLIDSPHFPKMVEIKLIYRDVGTAFPDLEAFPRDWNGGEDE